MKGTFVTDTLDISTTIRVLEHIPSCVVIIENNCIKWANGDFVRIFATPGESIIGLTTEQAADTAFEPLFGETERFCLTDLSGTIIWLQRKKKVLGNPGFEIHILEDITHVIELEKEREELILNLRELEDQDSAAGILNRLSLMQALSIQVSRSRRYENPLALLRLTLNIPASASEKKSDIMLTLSQDLKDQLRWADQIGMLDDLTFLVILPETSYEDAKELAPKLASSRTALASISPQCALKFAVTEWQKGDDPQKLLKKLENDLELDTAALFS